MYQVGEHVLYCLHGVCKINAIEDVQFGDVKQNYYILKPVFDSGATVFVPTDKEKLVSKMLPLLPSETVMELIDGLPNQKGYWIEFEPDRKEQYKQIIEGDDRKLQLSILKGILLQRKKLLSLKRKMHSSDEMFLKNVEKRICEEFCFVLEKSKDELSSIIHDNLGFSLAE